MDNVIDKDYKFIALCDGFTTDVIIHLSLTHDQVMDFGEMFSQLNVDESNEVDDFFIKGLLDETEANFIAQNLLDEWNQEEEERTIDDFYDEAYDSLACNYFGYQWSPELKNDCISYYQKHQ